MDQAARDALASSLSAVFDACDAMLAADPHAQRQLLAALVAHSVPPAAFALYAALVDAVMAGDVPAAQSLMDALLRPRMRERVAPRVVTLDTAALGAGLPAVYVRTVADDAATPLCIGAVDAAELARTQALHLATTELLAAAAPALLGEMAAIAHEIVLVQDTGTPAAGVMGFDGASTFYLWGAVLLNSQQQRTRVQLATALAHEAGHAVLFGNTLGAPLVQNDPAQTYHSPLRADPRPMDGVVHASFVLARMVWCQDHLLGCGLLRPPEQQEVHDARAVNRRHFAASVALIEAEAAFTPTGHDLWTAARDWMASSP
jgi:hypothetical protein